MNTYKNIFAFFFLFTLSFSHAVDSHAQEISVKGTSFHLGFMENLSPAMNGAPKFSLFFEATENTDVTIYIPGKNFYHELFVPAGEVFQYDVPGFSLEPRGSGVVSNLGIIVTATKPIGLIAVHNRLYFSASTRVLPDHIAGKDYLIVTHKDDGFGFPTEFLVVAHKDNTELDICLSPCGSKGRVKITLNEGQTYQVKSLEDLSGTIINASEYVTVFSGAQQAGIKCHDDSHIYFSMPAMYLGDTAFALVADRRQNSNSFYRIQALENNTTVTLDNDSSFILNFGQSREFSLGLTAFVRSSRPIQVSQYHAASSCNESGAGPAMDIVQAAWTGDTFAMFKTKESFGAAMKHSVTIIVTDTTNVFFDLNKVFGFSQFPGKSLFFKRFEIEDGKHQIRTENGMFWGKVYGYSYAEYYTYKFWMNQFDTYRPFDLSEENCGFSIITSNPTDGIFRVRNGADFVQNQTVTIRDGLGRLVSERYPNSNLDYNISDLAKGIYFLQLEGCNRQHKIILYH